MKTKSFMFLSIFVFMFMVLSCQKADIIIPEDETDTTIAVFDGVEPEMLTKYSWRVCKYVFRRDDSSLYDISYNFLANQCDTSIYTFNSDGNYYVHSTCENSASQEWWSFKNDYSHIAFRYKENEFDIEELYKVEMLSKDTLKLYILDELDPVEAVIGNIIYLYSIPKEEHQ